MGNPGETNEMGSSFKFLDLQFRPISNNFDEPRKGRRTARAQSGSMISQITALKETYNIRGS